MFYPIEPPQPTPGAKQAAALAVLNPAQSRRLVAKGAIATPLFQRAYKEGLIVIARGITNAYLSEELFEISIANKANQTIGLIGQGATNIALAPPPCEWHVIDKGQVLEGADSNEEMKRLKKDDIVIKGANAIDPSGLTGTYASSLKCGTMGAAWPLVTPRGAHFLVPVGLEKLIPCVMTAAAHSGVYHFTKSTGLPAKIVPLPESKAVTEIESLALLCGVRAACIGAGGVAGSEGSVHLALEGDEDKVAAAFELVKSLKDEPPVGMPDKYGVNDPADFGYEAQAQLDVLGGM